MTPHQRKLARHALGLPNSRRKSYRNHFVASEGHDDFQCWMAMRSAGFAKHRKGNSITGGDDVFWLTLAGALAALEPRESLDLDDFPEASA